MKRIASVLLILSLALAMALGLAGCSGAATPSVYCFFSFEGAQADAMKSIAREYTAKTGIPVTVETVSPGSYEEQLARALVQKDAPTIFQVDGPAGYSRFQEYTANLGDSEMYAHLLDEELAVSNEKGVFALPFGVEGYGIVVNTAIMDIYFLTDGAKVTSLDEIRSFETLRSVVEDMQGKKRELGIDGVFAATSLQEGQADRWSAQLLEVPLYYEWAAAGADLTDPKQTRSIEFSYGDQYRQIFDLYLNNSTLRPDEAGEATEADSLREFAQGEAAMMQNKNGIYQQILDVDSSVISPGDLTFLPIYIGAEGEGGQGICIVAEEYVCVNGNVRADNQKAALDFLSWLYTNNEGVAHVRDDLGFLAPYDTFPVEADATSPLTGRVLEMAADIDARNIPVQGSIYPGGSFREDFAAGLRAYAGGDKSWDEVRQSAVDSWAAQKKADPEEG